MAPILGEDWVARLRALQEDWDSYGGKPIDPRAIETVKNIATVPSSDGGIQLEIHKNDMDLLIEIGPDGMIESVFFGRI